MTDPALTCFAGRAGHHTDRLMRGAPLLAAALADRLGVESITIGEPEPALAATWDIELSAALPALARMAARIDAVLAGGGVPVSASGVCSVSLATIPVVARHRPDAVVVWFDAHADLNTPQTSTTGFLGGMALAGSLGLWDSGLGSGLRAGQVVLVGGRDLDPPEQALIDTGRVALVPVAEDMAERLRAVVAGRPVYLHLDCDVLQPGLVPTDYRVASGMRLEQLEACARVLGESELVGIEIAELEAPETPVSAMTFDARLGRLLDALAPLRLWPARPRGGRGAATRNRRSDQLAD